jgi:hypothetical protein
MQATTHGGDFTSYVAGRHDALVRTTVLLGVPPSAAPPLVAEAAARARRAQAGDGGRDPDVELFGALLDAVREDRRPWWSRPPTADDRAARDAVRPVEPALDRLTPEARARVVLAAVARLAPEQVDDVLAGADVEPDAGLVEAVAVAARSIPAAQGSPTVLQAAARRTTTRSAASWGAAVLGVVLVALVLWSAGRPGTGTPVAVGAASFVGVGAREAPVLEAVPARDPVALPVAWHADGVVRVGDREVEVEGVVSLDGVPDGVVARTVDDRLLVVGSSGIVTRLAELVPGSAVAASGTSGVVAYVDADLPGEVTVYDTLLDAVVTRVPVDAVASVAAVDGSLAYVNDGDGHLVTGPGGAARRTNGVTVLDAADGVLAVVAEQPGSVVVLVGGTPVLSLPGDAVDLSPDGRLALVTEEGALPRVRLVEVAGGRTLPLTVDPGDTLTDAAFGRDGSVVVVASGPSARPSRDRGILDTTPRRSDLLVCDPSTSPTPTCVRAAQLGGSTTTPILAH